MAELQKLLRYINVSDADMEKGSMRCDCNVSVKPQGSKTLGERCEIKNLNSKRFAREAVIAEARRQIQVINEGGLIINRTMQYDVDNNRTLPMRDKEGVADYRYFPDPDLPPIHVTDEHLQSIKAEMPKLPWEEKARLTSLGLNDDYAEQLAQSPAIIALFDRLRTQSDNTKLSANFMINQWLPTYAKDQDIIPISEDTIVSYLSLIDAGKVSTSIAVQQLWPALLADTAADPTQLAETLGILIQKDENSLETMIHEVLDQNPNQVKQYKGGKKALFGFFIGAVMRASGGSVDPKQLKDKLTKILNN